MQFTSVIASLRHLAVNIVITRSEDHSWYSRLANRPGPADDCDAAMGLAKEAALGSARPGELDVHVNPTLREVGHLRVKE
jgi:hypothetical protein